MKLSAFPFIRLCISLTAGILFEIEYNTFISSVNLLLFSLCLLYSIIIFIDRRHQLNLKLVSGIISLSATFLFGISLCHLRNDFYTPGHILNIKQPIEYYAGVVNEEVEEKASTYKCELLVNKVRLDGEWIAASGKVLVYIYKKDIKLKPGYGDGLLVKGCPQLINHPLNPDEFNLKKYYSFQGIAHQHFISSNKYIKFEHKEANFLYAFSLILREKINAIFIKYIPSERERNIASALILGIKNPLDNEIKYAYSATGTMHVLAVSGMHVGIIYSLLLLLTSVLLKLPYGNIIRAVILGILLWIYAFVTGLCPSVLRAVAMLSLVIIANLINRKNVIYNTLFLTAFALLCYNPFLIMDVGFQLSFLAVLGIIFIFPKINSWIDSDNKILNWFWEIIGMSVAAQLATFPLSLFYFHQFPNYFLISNLIVIPFAILIMYTGFAFLILSTVPLTGHLSGSIIEKLVNELNRIVLAIEKMPYSTFKGIHISIFETWLLYAIITGFILIFIQKRFSILVIVFLMVLIFSSLQVSEIITQKQQHQLIIYHVDKFTAIDFIDGEKATFISYPPLTSDNFKFQFHILNHRWASGVNNIDGSLVEHDLGFARLVVWNNMKLLIFEHRMPLPLLKQKMKVDYILIENNALKDMKYLCDNYSFQKVIIDGSNNRYSLNKITDEAKKNDITPYFTVNEGAFCINLFKSL